MKTSFKVLVSIGVLGVVILLGLHLFLQFGLTNMMRKVVLPQIKADYGIDARVGRLSINLPNGLLYLKEVEVKNPEGFLLENMVSIERVVVQVNLFSLLNKKPVLVNRVEVENALFNVIRNQEGAFNIDSLQAAVPPSESVQTVGKQLPENVPESGKELPAPSSQPAPSEMTEPQPLPEVLIEAIACRAKLRYIDLKMNQFDISLDLALSGSNLSTLRDPSAPWGDLSLIGSLGNRRTSFLTDLHARLAPLVDPESPSFDLTGKVMEIDPRILEEAYDKLGIRSAPFGFEPRLLCREGQFGDSFVTLEIKDIVLEDKLADRLGGMASIGSLRVSVPIEGTVQAPMANVQAALTAAIGGNAQALVSSFLGGMLAQEVGTTNAVPEDLTDAAVEVLAAKVDEVGESETVQQVLKDLANGNASDTNSPAPVSTDTLIDVLGEQVDEIGENEELKNELKGLGKWLFGK